MFAAITNTPGYSPSPDEVVTFDTAREAWQYLADERVAIEDWVEADEIDFRGPTLYSQTVKELLHAADSALGEGTIYGATPGYAGSHDLGVAYTVQAVA